MRSHERSRSTVELGSTVEQLNISTVELGLVEPMEFTRRGPTGK